MELSCSMWNCPTSCFKNAKNKMQAIRDERDSSSASSFFTSLIHKSKRLYTYSRGESQSSGGGRDGGFPPKPWQYKEALALMGVEGDTWTHLAEMEKRLYKKAWVKAQSSLPPLKYGKDQLQEIWKSQANNKAGEP
jgi:hypothetical protein